MVEDPETAAEYAHELYSYLDSSAGDYNDLLEELRPYESSESVHEVANRLSEADQLLTHAFETLDEVLSDASFDEDPPKFTSDTSEELATIARFLSSAEDALAEVEEEAADASVDSDFKFGAYTTVERAFQYVYSDTEHMRYLAEQMRDTHS